MKYLDIRLGMKGYIKSVMEEASANGSPALRTMFYEFPDDPQCWELSEQYMFGPDYLVAPVLYEGQREKEVYFPAGEWENIYDGSIRQGGGFATVPAPLEAIPVFRRVKK